MWNRIKRLLVWVLGIGPCFTCGKVTLLTHYRTVQRDKQKLHELRYEAYLCRKCLKEREAIWDKEMKEKYGDFDRMFEEFEKDFKRGL